MKKLFLALSLSLVLISLLSAAGVVQASACPAPYNTALVPCGQLPTCQCTFTDFFTMILRIYSFAIEFIAFPLAAFMVVVSGVVYIVSGGNPGTASTAKNILIYSFAGLAL